MRRLALALLLLPLAAACGGGSTKKSASPPPPPSTSAPSDPGRAAVAALFRAASHDDKRALWKLLSTRSQQRLGGYATFARRGAAALERSLAPFGSTSPVPFISQGLSEQFGVVAIQRGTRALAFTVRNQNGVTKIELSSPLKIRIFGPAPGSTGAVTQIAVDVHSKGVVDDAVVWLDGQLLHPTLAPARGKATVFVALGKPLPKGPHVAVVYAEEGNEANAEAWSFNASG
jgi:hypothetical protein